MDQPAFPIELVPLASAKISLAKPIILRNTPSATRVIVEWLAVEFVGERIKAHQHGGAAGDWITFGPEGTAGLDIRLTLKTDDDAIIFVQAVGRTDVSGGPGAAPSYCAWQFETDDARYAWMNKVQAISKGKLVGDTFIASLYEPR